MPPDDSGTTVQIGRQKTRTRLDPVVRRELIVDAAERVFADRDPSQVTFEEIAEAAGVSRALVYNYFGDKSGLVAALYFRSFRELDAKLAKTLDVAGEGPDRLRAVVECYLRFAAEHVAAWRLIGSAEAGTHPEVQRAREVRFDRMAAALGGGPEAHIVAHAVIGMLEAATVGWLEADDVDLDLAVEVIHRMVWKGLDGIDGLRDLELPRSGWGAVLPREPSREERAVDQDGEPSAAAQQYQAATLR